MQTVLIISIIIKTLVLSLANASPSPLSDTLLNFNDYKGIDITFQPFMKVLDSYLATLMKDEGKNEMGKANGSNTLFEVHKSHDSNEEDVRRSSPPRSSTEKSLPEPPCITIGGKTPDRPCIFPFIYDGIEHTTCTWEISLFTNNKPWCSTQVDENRVHIRGQWGNCDPDLCHNKYPPRECGVPAKRRRWKRIIDENDLDIQEIPWMASLGTFSNGKWEHHCGGSLISHRFILTSAHCLDNTNSKGLRVRLGNADLNIHTWVRKAYSETRESSLYEVKSAIKRTHIHPKFILHQSYFDIGLAETEEYIPYTYYVRPICLPFEVASGGDDHVNDLVVIAGWGLDENGEKSNVLKRTRLQVYPKNTCEKMFPVTDYQYRDVRNVTGHRIQLPEGMAHDLICIGSEIQRSVACHGDSGSPSVRKVFDTFREPYFEQLFIVTTGTSCSEDATIYSRVNHPEVLPWIRKIAGMEHHLIAIGGFSPNRTNKLLRDVEFLSSGIKNICQNRIGLLNGRLTENFFHSAAARGMTGIVAKDALVVCGGTNSVEHLKTCHMYNASSNDWSYTGSLNYSRADASAVLSPDGNFWILGGANGSKSADSTEVFELTQRKWRRAAPLPSELRNSGISFHCSVRLNNSHILLTGGYAAPYVFRNPFRESVANTSKEEDAGYSVPGLSLRAAWIFDGYYWKRIADMKGNRDRPACSVLNDNGLTKVIVAGGCRDWCEISPAIQDVEIYDPQTNEWSLGTPLPEPLHSAKMEEFLGLPTIVGGFNRTSQTGRIYSYEAETMSWRLLGKRLKLPRSSHALIKVPYEMFEHC